LGGKRKIPKTFYDKGKSLGEYQKKQKGHFEGFREAPLKSGNGGSMGKAEKETGHVKENSA